MRTVVLAGLGHTNLHVLRRWVDDPFPGARLVCVSEAPVSVYSGMLPGYLACEYTEREITIDLPRLARAAGARLVVGTVTGLDPGARRLHVEGRDPIAFDVLSLGIGSTPTVAGVRVLDDSRMVPTKPMASFPTRLAASLRSAGGRDEVHVAVVGGGAAGVEIALGLPPFGHAVVGREARVSRTIVTGSRRVLDEAGPGFAWRTERACRRAGVTVIPGARVVAVDGRRLTLDDRSAIDADVTIWATTAVGPAWLADSGLPLDPSGFVRTHSTLQVASGDPIFVVGDTGSMPAGAAKAGVFAVRQGPVLWDNLRRHLAGRPLRPFRPQRRYLKLLNTGDGRAVGEWRGLTFEGAWVRRWKDHLDRTFMRRFQVP